MRPGLLFIFTTHSTQLMRHTAKGAEQDGRSAVVGGVGGAAAAAAQGLCLLVQGTAVVVGGLHGI